MKIGRAKVSNLRKLYESCIKIHDISEPLYAIDALVNASEAKSIMFDLDYNVVGVKKGNKVTGYLRREDLKQGKCFDYVIPFEEDNLVPAEGSLLSYLHLYKSRTFLFGMNGNQVDFIATHSDLQKIPMRMILFGLLSLLELHLLNIIRKHYPQENWLTLLSKNRINKAREIQDYRKKKNENIDLLECIQFGDKKKIFEKTPELVEITNKTKGQLHSFFEDAELARDNLTHVQDFLGGKSWREFIQLVEEMKEFILKCESLE